MTDFHSVINYYLGEFASRSGTPRLVLNGEGICSFTFENQFEVIIENPEKSVVIYFYASVMSLPAQEPLVLVQLYEGLLKLNAVSSLTHGATVALDPEKPRVLLCYQYPVEALDDTLFCEILKNFISLLQDLYAEINDYLTSMTSLDRESGLDVMQVFLSHV